MTNPESGPEGAPSARPNASGKARAFFALGMGGLVLLVWAGLIASSFAGMSESANRQIADVLFGVVAVCTLASLLASVRSGIVTAVAAVAYAVSWWNIGWSLTYAIADIAYYALIATFFIAPPVAGVSGILAGRSRLAQEG